ncbi:hypothetical protein NP233_g9969 [Leucocoprinus birnbaumii]|uniref:Cytochrome P450 n=1 Tax=Leucocoprinus birnbaumii TaxID=56174 RepID=A0AAD5YQC6_9AGAR|nr:hypothetical protein NP233_g9969 [Leucocoprinus birnbaumii]
MSMNALDAIAVALCTLLSVGIWRYRKARRLPPGPPATFLGNAHHIPRTENWVAFKNFADQYNSSILCLWMFNSETFILNDYRTATALLDHRSSIYSSRPTFWMAGYLAGRTSTVFGTKSTNPRFKIYRTLLHKTLNPRAIRTYRALQLAECQTLLKGLLETPDDFIAHLRRNAIAIIMSVAYGYQVKSNDDKFVNILEETLRLAGVLNTPGKFWVEFLPILRYVPAWLPGAGFRKLARSLGQTMGRLENVPYKWATSQVLAGSYDESFVSDHIHDQSFAPTLEEKDDILKWCAAALFVGGGDTVSSRIAYGLKATTDGRSSEKTVSVMTTFFLLMARHPEIQQRAREEVDTVLGGNMATHSDQASLPYINAVIKEVLRWGPVVPLGIPHQVTEDDFYDGYLIPKDTRIISNIWAMAYDENEYPNPSAFDPTRFLGDNKQLDPLKYIFGFGRRVCPGLDLAEASLFINITNILANFIISKKRGPDGQEIEPEAKWTTGVTAHLMPFPCQITPRSPTALRSMLSVSAN